ncbi:MAG: hypothetical protein HC927_13910 [Deltaproteobacteria bacterium]|nr:hypothetical protein [Deltaproteobacteria bacterium]
MSSSLSWAIAGDVLIAFNRPHPIPDDVFELFIKTIPTYQYAKLLATSTGPANISSTQRKHFSEIFRSAKVATVSDHRLTRGVITAMGWLGLDIKAFGWDRLRDAVEYLDPRGVTPAELNGVTLKLREKSMRLDSVA